MSNADRREPELVIDDFSDLQGRTFEEVYARAQALNCAGSAEAVYVLEHSDSRPAEKLKDGEFYFFFGATEDGVVPSIFWCRGEFEQHDRIMGHRWESCHRAVLLPPWRTPGR